MDIRGVLQTTGEAKPCPCRLPQQHPDCKQEDTEQPLELHRGVPGMPIAHTRLDLSVSKDAMFWASRGRKQT